MNRPRRTVEMADNAVLIFVDGNVYEFTLDVGERGAGEASATAAAILSPMPGKIVSVSIKPGASREEGRCVADA